MEDVYNETIKLYVTYKNALKTEKKMSKLKLLEVSIKNLKKAVQAKIVAANHVVLSSDEDIRRTTKIMKTELRSSYDFFNCKVTEYLELKLECHSDTEDDTMEGDDTWYLISIDEGSILKKVKAISIILEAIATRYDPVVAGIYFTSL